MHFHPERSLPALYAANGVEGPAVASSVRVERMTCVTDSILRRLLHVVDDEYIHHRLGRLQL
jgi:hypothetical protein